MNIPFYMKRPRVLIVGCGDIGQRVAEKLVGHYRVLALARSDAAAATLRQLGITPIRGDLDQRRSLQRLCGLAAWVIHLAPPRTEGHDDARTRHLLAALRAQKRSTQKRPIVAPARLLYISTSGVYGDCAGQQVRESRPCRPQSARALRRAAAEREVRRCGRAGRWRTSILRVPGIHGPDRLPLQRLGGGQPVMRRDEDSWGNHVGADDLAHAITVLLHRGRPQRVYNVCDSDPQPMGQYLNRLCAALGLPPLPEVSRAEAEQRLSPSLWSFQRESRRLDNGRLQRETRWRPTLATVDDLIRQLASPPLE